MNRSIGNRCGIARLVTVVGMAVMLGGIVASPASATPVDYTELSQINYGSNWFVPGYQSSYGGGPLAGSRASTGISGSTTVSGTTITGSAIGVAEVDHATAAVKTSALINPISQTGPDLAPGLHSIFTSATATMGETFSILADSSAALLPGAVATVTFSIDGVFTLSEGLDLLSGDSSGSIFEPNTYLLASGSLGVYQQGAFDLSRQLDNLDSADFATYHAFLVARQALIDELESKTMLENSVITATNQQLVDGYNALAGVTAHYGTDGAVNMIVSVDVPLSALGTTFEWISRLRTVAVVDLSEVPAFLEADFASTGVLTITVPDGFSVVASGKFPQANVTVLAAPGTPAVPEPVTAALGVMSIAGLMIATRRRRVA